MIYVIVLYFIINAGMTFFLWAPARKELTVNQAAFVCVLSFFFGLPVYVLLKIWIKLFNNETK